MNAQDDHQITGTELELAQRSVTGVLGKQPCGLSMKKNFAVYLDVTWSLQISSQSRATRDHPHLRLVILLLTVEVESFIGLELCFLGKCFQFCEYHASHETVSHFYFLS